MIHALNKATEFCLLSLCITNIKITFGDVLAKQGEDFSTTNISFSNSTFPPDANMTWRQQLSPRPRAMQGVCGPRNNSHITRDWQKGKLTTRCFSASLCKTVLWTTWRRKLLMLFLSKQSSLEMAWLVLPLQSQWNGNRLQIQGSQLLSLKMSFGIALLSTCWGNQFLKQVSIPQLLSHYTKHSH